MTRRKPVGKKREDVCAHVCTHYGCVCVCVCVCVYVLEFEAYVRSTLVAWKHIEMTIGSGIDSIGLVFIWPTFPLTLAMKPTYQPAALRTHNIQTRIVGTASG